MAWKVLWPVSSAMTAVGRYIPVMVHIDTYIDRELRS